MTSMFLCKTQKNTIYFSLCFFVLKSYDIETMWIYNNYFSALKYIGFSIIEGSKFHTLSLQNFFVRKLFTVTWVAFWNFLLWLWQNICTQQFPLYWIFFVPHIVLKSFFFSFVIKVKKVNSVLNSVNFFSAI